MQWQLIVALVLIVPVIILPVVFVAYLNLRGSATLFAESRRRRAIEEKLARSRQ